MARGAHWHLEFVVEVRQCPLASGAPSGCLYLHPGSRSGRSGSGSRRSWSRQSGGTGGFDIIKQPLSGRQGKDFSAPEKFFLPSVVVDWPAAPTGIWSSWWRCGSAHWHLELHLVVYIYLPAAGAGGVGVGAGGAGVGRVGAQAALI